MKKLLLIIICAITLSGCAFVKQTLCPTITETVCPVIGSLLDLGISFTISPVTGDAHKVFVTGKGIQTLVCDITTGICSQVDSALAAGKSVEITPVKYSSNRVNTSAGLRYVLVKVK